MPGIYLRIPDSWNRIKTNCAAGKGKSAAKASAGKTPRVQLFPESGSPGSGGRADDPAPGAGGDRKR